MKNQENSKKGDGQDAAKDPQLLLEARPTGELEWHDPALAAAAREEQAEAQTRMAAEAARGDAPHGVAPAGAAQIEEPGAAAEPMVAVVTERTGCGRPTRLGLLLPSADAEAYCDPPRWRVRIHGRFAALGAVELRGCSSRDRTEQSAARRR